MHPQNTQVSNPTPEKPIHMDLPAIPPPQPHQVGDASDPTSTNRDAPRNELMELDIPEDKPDLTDIPDEVLSDFDAWAHSMLDYEW